MDVTDKKSIIESVEKIREEDGKLDILINKYVFFVVPSY